MTMTAAHPLTLMAEPRSGMRQGVCRCGRSWTASDVDNITGAHAAICLVPVCAVCQDRPAAVESGCVSLCGRCALDEFERNAAP